MLALTWFGRSSSLAVTLQLQEVKKGVEGVYKDSGAGEAGKAGNGGEAYNDTDRRLREQHDG